MRYPMLGSVLLTIPLGSLGCATPPATGEVVALDAPGLRTVAAAEIDALFADVDAEGSPGCALLVLRDGEVVHGRGYGMANLEYGIPIDTDSVFRIGSTSKQFTAACALLAEQQGLLGLDDTVGQWFPELGEAHALVTLRQAMHHTGGIRDYLTLLALSGRSADDDISLGELLALIGRQEALDFAPGSSHSYSNSGYLILAEAVARASGMSLAEFADEHIFTPLGMDATSFCDDATALVPRRAEGHYYGEDGWHIGRTGLSVVGDGGVFTSVRELAKWDAHFYGGRIGDPGLLEAQHTVGMLNDGTALDYAAGLMVTDHHGVPMVLHGGAFTGFRAELVRFPGQHLSIICLSNMQAYDPTSACLAIADLYLADLYDTATVEAVEDGSAASEAPSDPQGEPPAAAPVLPLPEGVLGTYYSRELDVKVELEQREDALWYVLPYDAWGPFPAIDEDLIGAFGVELALTRDAAGAIDGFALSLGRASGIAFERLGE